MSALFSDTHPKMEALQIQLWRQASATRKMQMLAQLNASARIVALAGLRARHPQASEVELRRRLAGLLLGEEAARKVYGEIGDANERIRIINIRNYCRLRVEMNFHAITKVC